MLKPKPVFLALLPAGLLSGEGLLAPARPAGAAAGRALYGLDLARL